MKYKDKLILMICRVVSCSVGLQP